MTRPRPPRKQSQDKDTGNSPDTRTPTLRVLTLNVHGWTDPHAVPNAWRVAELVRDSAPDLVGFQEVSSLPVMEPGRARTSTLAWLADVCGYQHSGADRRGCALLSRFPITAAQDITYTRGKNRDQRPSQHVESRLLACAVESPKGPLRVMVLHLNHAHAERRLQQIEHVFEAYEAGVPGGRQDPCLWLGDFNALSRCDYNKTRWQEITAERQRNRWEDPRTDVVDRLGRSPLRDCWRHAGAGGPVTTCRFGTRVDYIWADSKLLAQWSLTDCRALQWDGSDHRPVLATFRG